MDFSYWTAVSFVSNIKFVSISFNTQLIVSSITYSVLVSAGSTHTKSSSIATCMSATLRDQLATGSTVYTIYFPTQSTSTARVCAVSITTITLSFVYTITCIHNLLLHIILAKILWRVILYYGFCSNLRCLCRCILSLFSAIIWSILLVLILLSSSSSILLVSLTIYFRCYCCYANNTLYPTLK